MTNVFTRGTASIRDNPFFDGNVRSRGPAGFRPAFGYTMPEIQMLENEGQSVTDLLGYAFPKSELHADFKTKSAREQLQFLGALKKLMGKPGALSVAERAEQNAVRVIINEIAADPEVNPVVAEVAAELVEEKEVPDEAKDAPSHAMQNFDFIPEPVDEDDVTEKFFRSNSRSNSRARDQETPPRRYVAGSARFAGSGQSQISTHMSAPASWGSIGRLNADGSVENFSLSRSLSRARDLEAQLKQASRSEWFDDDERDAPAPAASSAAAAAAAAPPFVLAPGRTIAQRLLDPTDPMSGSHAAPKPRLPQQHGPNTNAKFAQTEINREMVNAMKAGQAYEPKRLTVVSATAYARETGLKIPEGQDAKVFVNRFLSAKRKNGA